MFHSPEFLVARLDPVDMVKRSLFCRGPNVALGDWFWPRGASVGFSESWPQLEGRTVIGTHRGRTAVALACRLLGLGEGHEVLVPAYNCGAEIDALRYSGVIPVGYRVSRRCEIDLDDLIARKTNRTKAVYLIHYFGWEQPMEQLRRWCGEQGLLLIEDCALALFSGGQTQGIGRTGDAAIYSLPKSLGFFYGGLLALSTPPKAGLLAMKASGTASWYKEIRYSARFMAFRNLERLGVYGALISAHRRRRSGRAGPADSEGLPDMPDDRCFNPTLEADRKLHPNAAAILDSIRWQNIVRARRENYQRLGAIFEGIQGGEPLFSKLPQGVCPLSFPLLVSNRDRCARVLHLRGISALPWWPFFHHGALDWSRFPDACWLKHNVMTVPVYQGMGARQLDEMAASVVEVLDEVPKGEANPAGSAGFPGLGESAGHGQLLRRH